MQMYIPSFLNLGGALASPYLNYILEASISEYNTDFYSRHLVGIPLMVRMGSDGKLARGSVNFVIKGRPQFNFCCANNYSMRKIGRNL